MLALKAIKQTQIPAAVRLIVSRLREQGWETCLVGGCVRDLLLGKTPADWDLATAALPDQVRAAFPQVPLLEQGLKHGTLGLVLERQVYEITSFRQEETYLDHRHPDQVLFTTDLNRDLARRDFTVNAMAWWEDGGLRDPFGGQADLRQGLLRCVGLPDRRFNEDALRMMRALRFMAVLGFSLHPDTARALRQHSPELTLVAVERLRAELDRLLTGASLLPVLLDWKETLAVILPEIRPLFGLKQPLPWHIYDAWEHSARAAAEIAPQLRLRLAALCHDLGKAETASVKDGTIHFYGHAAVSRSLCEGLMLRLKYAKALRATVTHLVARHDVEIPLKPAAVRRRLQEFGQAGLQDLLALKRADIMAQNPALRPRRLASLQQVELLLQAEVARGSCFSLSDLAVNGRDLLAIGLRGPAVGQGLRLLLEQVVEGRLPNDRPTLLQAARNLRP
ncbi:MAG: HD domain-containing protein [Oscillospiraceae bacterium]|nr:HD domain-containing protein [Oscillospiraceae bacterium]MDD4368852.1 HD domain-containing protein [Oscillospiraceae bacterium]